MLICSAYGSTTEEDLYDAIERAVKEDNTLPSHLNVHKICKSWTNWSSYPTLYVARYYGKDKPHEVAIEAGSFLLNWVPFNFATAKNLSFDDTSPHDWLSDKPKPAHYMRIDGLTADDWIIFNKQQTSFYRVQYDKTNYKLLAAQLNSGNFTIIHVLNRAQLIDDLYEFVNLNQFNILLYLELSAYLTNETEYAPWVSAARVYSQLNQMFSSQSIYPRFRMHGAKLIENQFNRLGLDDIPGENILNTHLRAIAIDLACAFGLPKCLEATHMKLNETINHSINVNAAVLRNAVRSAADNEIEALWKRLVNTNDSNARAVIIESFAFISPRKALESVFNRSLTDHSLSRDEKRLLFTSTFRTSDAGLSICIQLLANSLENKLAIYDIEEMKDLLFNMADLVFNEERKDEVIMQYLIYLKC